MAPPDSQAALILPPCWRPHPTRAHRAACHRVDVGTVACLHTPHRRRNRPSCRMQPDRGRHASGLRSTTRAAADTAAALSLATQVEPVPLLLAASRVSAPKGPHACGQRMTPRGPHGRGRWPTRQRPLALCRPNTLRGGSSRPCSTARPKTCWLRCRARRRSARPSRSTLPPSTPRQAPNRWVGGFGSRAIAAAPPKPSPTTPRAPPPPQVVEAEYAGAP